MMFSDIQPVTLSVRAIEEIKKIMRSKNIPDDYGLRVGVKGGGCGATLIIGFDKQRSGDHTYQVNEISVHVDKKHTLYLIGKEVDFYDGENGRGFMFTDPPKKNAE